MFVQTNSLKAIKKYFKEKLKEQFSESELNFMLKEAVVQRLNISRAEYLLSEGQLLSESDLLYFRSIVKRLQNHEPFQYIMGSTEFFGLEIKTDSRALIPRPETEELVQWITEEFPQKGVLKIMDLCTGSGCIALALKSYLSNSEILATDFSQEALELANENAKTLNLEIAFGFFDATKNDDYSAFPIDSYDVWVSNPPYIPFKDELKMQKNVLNFEPHLALFVENEDPLLFYRTISENALIYLKSEGKIFFEIHADFANETTQLLNDLGFVNIELRKDLQGKGRMLKGQKP